MRKIDGEQNPADLLTKNVNIAKVERYIQIINEEFREGRAEVGKYRAKVRTRKGIQERKEFK